MTTTNTPDETTLSEMAFHSANFMEPMSDWMLRYLVDLANLRGLEMSLTLQVNGMHVSGTLVGGQTYFDGITKDINAALGGNEETKAVAELFERVNAAVHTETTPDKLNPPPAYIHLKGARFLDAAGNAATPNGDGVWWRGKLSQVSGFFLGNLAV